MCIPDKGREKPMAKRIEYEVIDGIKYKPESGVKAGVSRS